MEKKNKELAAKKVQFTEKAQEDAEKLSQSYKERELSFKPGQ